MQADCNMHSLSNCLDFLAMTGVLLSVGINALTLR